MFVSAERCELRARLLPSPAAREGMQVNGGFVYQGGGEGCDHSTGRRSQPCPSCLH